MARFASEFGLLEDAKALHPSAIQCWITSLVGWSSGTRIHVRLGP